MFKLTTALKNYHEAGSLNNQINLFGFIDDHTFLTKGGDVGVVLAVKGVDYECLAPNEIDNYTKRSNRPSRSWMTDAVSTSTSLREVNLRFPTRVTRILS